MVTKRNIWWNPHSTNHSNIKIKKTWVKKHRPQAAAWLRAPPASQFWKFYEWKMSGFPKPHEFSLWFWWVHPGAGVWSVSRQTEPPIALYPHDNLTHNSTSAKRRKHSHVWGVNCVLISHLNENTDWKKVLAFRVFRVNCSVCFLYSA